MIMCAQLQEPPQDYILSSNNFFSAVALKSWSAANTEASYERLEGQPVGSVCSTRAAATSHICVLNN